MDSVAEGYARIIERFVGWATANENIRAAVIIGSRARTDHPADDWADLDILILAEDPTPVWQRTDWIDSLGEVWLTFSGITRCGQPNIGAAASCGGPRAAWTGT